MLYQSGFSSSYLWQKVDIALIKWRGAEHIVLTYKNGGRLRHSIAARSYHMLIVSAFGVINRRASA